MTIVSIFLCDYCAREIDPEGDWVKLRLASEKSSLNIADYHRTCWRAIEQAIKLAQNVGGSLEKIEVLTDQAMAELRRRHSPPGNSSY